MIASGIEPTSFAILEDAKVTRLSIQCQEEEGKDVMEHSRNVGTAKE